MALRHNAGETGSAPSFVIIKSKVLATKFNSAIDESLWYLHKTGDAHDVVAAISKAQAGPLFEGFRYSEVLREAAHHSYPNYYPYRLQPGETEPAGKGKADIPYLLTLPDGRLVRLKGSRPPASMAPSK